MRMNCTKNNKGSIVISVTYLFVQFLFNCTFFRLDTVGAVALDFYGKVASAASSGGLLMKLPGRVGQVSGYFTSCVEYNKIIYTFENVLCCGGLVQGQTVETQKVSQI